jgi:L-ascorbate metabolism protein UlaG (beta-lactamase superfamily)
MAFHIRWLGTACFEIRIENGKTIVIDPYLDDSVSAPIGADEVEGCDTIFLTHGHYDHVLDVGKLVRRFNPRVFCSRETCDALIEHQDVNPDSFHAVTVGDVVENDGFSAEVVRGVHVDFVAEYHRLTGGNLLTDFGDDFQTAVQKGLEASFGPVTLPENFDKWMTQYPGGEQLNFVFDLGGGTRIYMAGSYPDPDLINVAKGTRASLMLLQVLGGKTLGGLESKTAEFGLASGAGVIVPQHHDPLIPGAEPTDLTELKRIFAKHDANFREFEPGHWYSF